MEQGGVMSKSIIHNGANQTPTRQILHSGVWKAVQQSILHGGVWDAGRNALTVANTFSQVGNSRISKGVTNGIFRFPIEIRGNYKRLVFGFNNWYSSTSTHAPIAGVGNSLTLSKVSIEKSNGSMYAPVTFSGSRSITLADGATHILSDDILPASLGLSTFTNTTKYWVRIEASIPLASGYFALNSPNQTYTGQSQAYYNPAVTTLVNGADGVGAFTTTGTAPLVGSTGVNPIVLGELVDPSADNSWVVSGSSIEFGRNDTESWCIGSVAGGYAKRALWSLGCPILSLAIPGATTTTFVNSGEYLKPWYAHARYLIEGIGSNDIGAGSSYATIISNMQARFDWLKTNGYSKIVRNQFGMRTSSTDSWSTSANQTYATNFGPSSVASQVKDWLNSASAIGVYYDLITQTPSYRDPSDEWKWLVNGTANYPTADGTHPTPAMHSLIAADITPTLQQAMS